MTREHKLALIVGFALVLVVGILVSDHFSEASNARVSQTLPATDIGASPVDWTALESPLIADGLLLPMPDEGLEAPAADPEPAPIEPPAITMGQPIAQTDPASPAGSTVPRVLMLGGGRGLDPAVQTDTVTPITDPLTRDPQSQGPARSAPVGFTAPPNGSAPASQPAPVRRHPVQKGESLSSIARKYYGSERHWKAIAEANPGRVMAGGQVNAGVTLVIPALAGEKPAPARSSGATPARASGDKPADTRPAPASAGTDYVVKKGDTLASIASKQLGSAKRYLEIVRLNPSLRDDPDTIRVGMKLKLPAR